MRKEGEDGLKPLMGSLENSQSCNDLPQIRNVLQTHGRTEIEPGRKKENQGQKGKKEICVCELFYNERVSTLFFPSTLI